MQQDSETIETRSSNTFDTNARDGLTQQTSEGTRFLQSELESNPLLGTNKSKLLREAIDFVSRISDTSKPYFATDAFNPSETAGGFESTTFPPELLYMMTMGESVNLA